MLHPDRCRHPKGHEAFQKLNEANEWALDRPAWEEKQRAQAWRNAEGARFQQWIREGWHLKAGELEEQVQRMFCEVEEALLWVTMEEQWWTYRF